MALKAKSPDKKEKRLKMFVYGPAGVGKTCGVIQFKNSVIIDTEKGTDFYSDTINKANSVVLQTLNPDEIREELHSLLTEKHQYRTLIIDPITQVYNSTQAKWTRIFESYAKSEKEKAVQDFGMRYWGKVKSDFKGLQRLMLALDMNCIITAHQKDIYGTGMQKLGVGPDSMKGDDYLFDLVFRVERSGNDLIAFTVKERAEIGQNKFPETFSWSYDNFVKFYGKEIIEKEATPILMATKEDVVKLKGLLEVVNVPEGTVTKWLTKADCNSFIEMNKDQIDKCIAYLQKKLDEINKNGGKK